MILCSALVAISLLPALISGGQVPAVDQVIGGVPRPGENAIKTAKRAPALTDVKAKSERFSTNPIPGELRVVENSGVCETLEGVYQASGYGDLPLNKSIWFWFFAARNNPDTAPLVTWFQGGPGASSMLGLFQENGPCRINNDSTGVDLNPTSWNEFANVLYIDQPAGAGFSYGTKTVVTSQEAAIDVWEFLQIWFADPRFQKYVGREFGIWTEGYGGHFGPAFANFIRQQNFGIGHGLHKGAVPINLTVLGIGNGMTDPLSQYPGYIQYAQSNPYHFLANASVLANAETSWSKTGGCRDQIIACNNWGANDSICSAAQSYCNEYILTPPLGNSSINYVPTESSDSYPPDITTYLNSSAVTSKIGSQSEWVSLDPDIYTQFSSTGDLMRSSLLDLQTLIGFDIRTVLYNGDADYSCNYVGYETMIDSLDTKFSADFAKQNFSSFTVNGEPAGLYKNVGTFSYLRVFGAGRQVPAYGWGDVPRGAAALQMFTQIMSNTPLSGT